MSKNSPVLAGINCFKFSANQVLFPGNKETLVFKDGKTVTEQLTSSNGKAFMTYPEGTTPGRIKPIGVLGTMKISAYQPDGGVEVEFTVESRARVLDANIAPNTASVKRLTQRWEVTPELAALTQETLKSFVKILENSSVDSEERANTIAVLQKAAEDPLIFPDMLATCLKIDARELGMDRSQQLKLIETLDPKERLDLIYKDIMETLTKGDTQERLVQKQREYVLREQIKTAQQELGLDGEDENEFDALEKKIQEAGMPEEALKECKKELRRLSRAGNSEKSKIQDRLEAIIATPWSKYSETEKDPQKVADVMDAGIFGLKDVKEFVVEEVAVEQRIGKASGSVIDLIGEPGVGKTAIGEVIAKATGRKFVRVSLGGIHGEADIRGHRPTYVGSIVGRIIKAMQEAGTINPVIQLDEIDKMGGENGLNGDPSSALLEVLDLAQNHRFRDHFLGIDYDLSNVMFIASANDASKIPGPLYDRMENFTIDGYDDDEKMQIAKDHLIKKQMDKFELTDAQFSITDTALAKLIEGYTSEAGVRSLEKKIRKIARKAVKKIQEGKAESVTVTPENLEKYAGRKKIKQAMVDPTPRVGHVNGLAVSGSTGIVLGIEANMRPDPKGGFEATGSLAQVMHESAGHSYAYINSQTSELGISPEVYLNNTICIKAEPGSMPKDGPSAGLAMATLIASVEKNVAIRGDVAMTGEITLLGKSGVIGGLKQKLDGAFKAGIKTVLIPVDNLEDLEDTKFPAKLKEKLEIMPDGNAENLAEVPEGKMRVIPVKTEMEVLNHALVDMPEPLAVDEAADAGKGIQELLEGIDANDLRSLLTLAKTFAQVAQPQVAANDSTPQPAAKQPALVGKARTARRRPGNS